MSDFGNPRAHSRQSAQPTVPYPNLDRPSHTHASSFSSSSSSSSSASSSSTVSAGNTSHPSQSQSQESTPQTQLSQHAVRMMQGKVHVVQARRFQTTESYMAHVGHYLREFSSYIPASLRDQLPEWSTSESNSSSPASSSSSAAAAAASSSRSIGSTAPITSQLPASHYTSMPGSQYQHRDGVHQGASPSSHATATPTATMLGEMGTTGAGSLGLGGAGTGMRTFGLAQDRVISLHFDYYHPPAPAHTPVGVRERARRLALVITYHNGFQAWDVSGLTQASELISWHGGPIKSARFLPPPDMPEPVNPTPAQQQKAPLAGRRPILAVLSADNDLQSKFPYNTVRLFSVMTGYFVFSLRFRSEVLATYSSSRLFVVAICDKIYGYDAVTMGLHFNLPTYYRPNVMPAAPMTDVISLGTRWLAYPHSEPVPRDADPAAVATPKKTDLSRAVETTKDVAMSVVSGLSYIGDLGAQALSSYMYDTPSASSGSVHRSVSAPEAHRHRSSSGGSSAITAGGSGSAGAGTVAIYDTVGGRLTAIFRAHMQPIGALSMDPSGTLLLTAALDGHDFNIYQISPSPEASDDIYASHIHLYTLTRGVTDAVVSSVAWSLDSRWLGVCTARGTTHIYAINPRRGGGTSIHTHLLHTVHGRDAFHLPNHRPPLTSLSVIARIRQSYRPTPSPGNDRLAYQATVAARFVSQSGDDHQFLLATPAATCLEYDLHPRPPLQSEVNVDWRTLCLDVTPRAELDLCRQSDWQDCMSMRGDVLLGPSARSQSAADHANRSVSHCNEWFSNVEIATHHADRPLWSVPQFTFKPVGALGNAAAPANAPMHAALTDRKGKQPADEPAVITYSTELRSDAPIARSLLGDHNVSQGLADAMAASLVDATEMAQGVHPIEVSSPFVQRAADRPVEAAPQFRPHVDRFAEADPRHLPSQRQHVHPGSSPYPEAPAAAHEYTAQQSSADRDTAFAAPSARTRAAAEDSMVKSHERHPTPPRHQSPAPVGHTAQLEGLAAALDTVQFETAPPSRAEAQTEAEAQAQHDSILGPPPDLFSSDVHSTRAQQQSARAPAASPASPPATTSSAGSTGDHKTSGVSAFDDDPSWVRNMHSMDESWGDAELAIPRRSAAAPAKTAAAPPPPRLPSVNERRLEVDRATTKTSSTETTAARPSTKREPMEDSDYLAVSSPVSSAPEEMATSSGSSKSRRRRRRSNKGNGNGSSNVTNSSGTTLGAPPSSTLSSNPFAALEVSDPFDESSSSSDDGDSDPVLTYKLDL
mmetsp:Transcript_8689/g.26966  ORF Transcript_8689/g.26966 Transcript_8689/m.26966 type:complete len:1271 (-) Transcript_8689:24-3836(-)|eukprot:CAMPEP_0174236656 /NCGR_PEP_ID=MMETSP0417-20130205/5720_1 /TAXON_ID=242541 /ORGANISM="Mayorella sp, Strain BSH-02190019" /LENGTH=1270 /DNA_ID=CAMNT_0015315327 /DNA_START=201 /DNA_END=4013 /DNA_ORIENTATION=-